MEDPKTETADIDVVYCLATNWAPSGDRSEPSRQATYIATIPVVCRKNSVVMVQATAATGFHKRLLPGQYHDHYEDAVIAFRKKVAKLRKELEYAEADLEAMRKPLK